MRTFKVGTVINKLEQKVLLQQSPNFKTISVQYPSRLNAMAIDPSKIAINENHRYTPGEVIFVVKLFKDVEITLRDDGKVVVDSATKRSSLVRHAALIMQKALKTPYGFTISVQNQDEVKHCGLGSSSGLIAAVGVSINELFGKPIDDLPLLQYLGQNHGEEIDGDEERLEAVQCIGGSAAAGIVHGGMTVLSGTSRPIAMCAIPEEFRVVIGIPKDFKPRDAKFLMEAERRNLHKFIATGKKHGPRIAYRILHEMLPAMVEGDMKVIGDIIYEYRFEMGSIRNCSFVYPSLVKKASQLASLKHRGLADVLALSSVGPAFFAITKRPQDVARVFEANDFSVFHTKIHNTGYQVLRKVRI